MLQGSKKGRAATLPSSARSDVLTPSYSITFVNNILLLAIRYFLDEKTPGVLRVSAHDTAKPIFRERLYELLNNLNVAQMDVSSRIDLVSKVNDICREIQSEGLPLNNLWGDFIKASFMEASILNHADKRVERCWAQFAKKLRSIFNKCLKNEKNQELDTQHHNYEIPSKDQKAVKKMFFSFMKELLALEQRPSVQAIHNLFHIMSLCANNQRLTQISDFDISVLMRPVLLAGFKLENVLSNIEGEHDVRKHLFPEWCFMGTISLFLMKANEFNSEYNDTLYLSEEKEHKQRKRSHSGDTTAYIGQRKNSIKRNDNLKKSNESSTSSFLETLKAERRFRQPKPDDSISLARARGVPPKLPPIPMKFKARGSILSNDSMISQIKSLGPFGSSPSDSLELTASKGEVPLLPESTLNFVPGFNAALDRTTTMIEALTLSPRKQTNAPQPVVDDSENNKEKEADGAETNSPKGGPKNK